MSVISVIRRRRITPRTRRDLLKGLLFISPWLIHFLWLNLYPFFASAYFSLTRYTVIAPPRWVGLDNYVSLLRDDPRFWTSLYNTVYFTVFSVSLGTIFAIAMAMLLNMRVRGLSVYRTIYYLPSITPLVATAIIWIWLLNPQAGILNHILRTLGLPAPSWLGDPRWAKPSMILMSIWGVGGAIVIYLAGLQDIPRELLEAASLDGANSWQQTWSVRLPLLSPVIFFNVIVGLIGSFQYFTQAYVMTLGGPADATLFYSLYLYLSAFQFFKMGYASAMAWLLFWVIMACTLLIFRTSARWVYYGGR
jgi:multiple sugar transport system permease protein